MTSYMRSIVTMGLSRTISEINGDFGQKSQIFPTPCICAPTEVGIGIGYRRRGTIFTFVAFCYKHDISISRIVTQNTQKWAISRAKLKLFWGGHSPSPGPTPVGRDTLPTPYPLVAFGHSPARPPPFPEILDPPLIVRTAHSSKNTIMSVHNAQTLQSYLLWYSYSSFVIIHTVIGQKSEDTIIVKIIPCTVRQWSTGISYSYSSYANQVKKWRLKEMKFS